MSLQKITHTSTELSENILLFDALESKFCYKLTKSKNIFMTEAFTSGTAEFDDNQIIPFNSYNIIFASKGSNIGIQLINSEATKCISLHASHEDFFGKNICFSPYRIKIITATNKTKILNNVNLVKNTSLKHHFKNKMSGKIVTK